MENIPRVGLGVAVIKDRKILCGKEKMFMEMVRGNSLEDI